MRHNKGTHLSERGVNPHLEQGTGVIHFIQKNSVCAELVGDFLPEWCITDNFEMFLWLTSQNNFGGSILAGIDAAENHIDAALQKTDLFQHINAKMGQFIRTLRFGQNIVVICGPQGHIRTENNGRILTLYKLLIQTIFQKLGGNLTALIDGAVQNVNVVKKLLVFFEQLMKCGVGREDAYRFSEIIRKGRAGKDADFAELPIPESLKNVAKMYLYVWPKAHVVERLLIVARLAYYMKWNSRVYSAVVRKKKYSV